VLHLREGRWCRLLGTRWAEDLSLGFTVGIARRRDGVASVACRQAFSKAIRCPSVEWASVSQPCRMTR